MRDFVKGPLEKQMPRVFAIPLIYQASDLHGKMKRHQIYANEQPGVNFSSFLKQEGGPRRL